MVSSLSRWLRLVMVVVVVLGVMYKSCNGQAENAAGETITAGEQAAAGEQGEKPPPGEGGAGEGAAAAEKQRPPPPPMRLSQCRGRPKPSGTFTWFPFADPGKWYVSHVSSPMRQFRRVRGYALYLKQENIIEWRTSPLELEEIFATGYGCRRRSWECTLLGRYTSAARCGFVGRRNVRQKWIVIASDYKTSAAIYSEIRAGRQLYRKIYLLVRRNGASPNPAVIGRALNGYCGANAANPNSQFYSRLPSGAGIPCLMA